MIEDSVISLLRCPKTKQALRKATIAEKQEQGIPSDEDALATADGTLFYRALNSLPLLISATESAE